MVDHDTVKDQLNNAVQNGHDFADWTAEEMAIDLMCYSADFDGTEKSFNPDKEADVFALGVACALWKRGLA